MESEANRVTVLGRKEDINLSLGYDLEIELSLPQKIILFFLNIMTGGLGTILEPFLSKKNKSGRLIFAGILLGILQIFHILHFFSLFKEIYIFEKFYDYISDDKFLLLFFNDTDKDDKDKNFVEKLLSINISKIIAQKERKKFFKIFFGIISGMSYANSIFTVIINFLTNKDGNPNYKLGIKALLYSIFNPGDGFLLSSVVLIDSSKCCDSEKCDKSGFIISFIGVLFSIFLMICPIFLILGTYLIKITETYTALFPIKFTLLFIGIIGTLTSFSFSKIKKNSIEASFKEKINPFDIVLTAGEKIINLKSDFGLCSTIRILANLILPGIGTFSSICSNCFCCGDNGKDMIFCAFIIIGVLQLYMGGIFFYLIIDIIIGIIHKKDNDNCFVPSLLYTKDDEEYYDDCDARYNCCYAMHFLYYFSGILIIVISDYLPTFNKFFILSSMFILNLITGGFGTILFIGVIAKGERERSNNACVRIMIVLFLGVLSIPVHYNAIYFSFFHDLEQKVLMYFFLPLDICMYFGALYNYCKYGYFDS